MNNKLYVGNLDFGTTEDDLRNLFKQAGTVTDTDIIKDKESGNSRGFGFIEMKTEEEAKKAMEMFHEKEFQGRELTVEEAKPKRDDTEESSSNSETDYAKPDLDKDGIPYMR